MREDWIESKLQFIAKIEWGNTSITKKSYELNGYTAFSAAGPDGFLPQAEWFGEGVVLSAIGANCGKCFYTDGEWAAIKNTIVIQTESVNTKYLFHYLNNKFKWKISGTGQPFITLKNARQNPVPLAPLPEQRAIVAKIEELFSDLDKGIADLKKAQDQLVIFRQAVLKKAFAGELTKEWREQQTDLPTADELLEQIKEERQKHYEQQIEDWNQAVKIWEANGKEGKKPNRPKKFSNGSSSLKEDFHDLPKLPTNWSYIIPEDVSSTEKYSIGIGPFGSNLKVSDYTDSGVPLVFVRNITRNDFALNIKYISHEKYKELYAHSIKPLDILITKMGDPPGDCSIYPKNEPEAIITSDCLKFRVFEKYANRLFFKYLIESVLIKRQLGFITIGVAQKKISVERFKTLLFPFTSLHEQHQIVQEIESRLSVCDKVEESIKESLEKAKALRQSILKKAFEGTLLSAEEIAACKTAPDYEPASVLLEKIKAEKKKP
jgi:type I restriction enzyme S subunit